MKILCFGSLNIDYVYSLDHFVRAGETIHSKALNRFCGGKGLNQAIAAAKAGGEVYMAGKVGNDGLYLIDELKSCGVNCEYIEIVDKPSGHAIIQVENSGQNSIILFGGANRMIDEKYVDYVMSGFEKGDLILLQNEINCLSYIIDAAYKKGLHIALNPSPYESRLYDCNLDYVTWFLLNEIEGYELTKKNETDEILKNLIQRFPQSKVILTLGSKGAVYYESNKRINHGVYNVDVVDTTAAGDTFTGYFISAISQELSPEQALQLASVASSLAVSKKGASTSIPLKSEVDNAELKLVLK